MESELRLRLASSGAIVIEGPKACGKTATAQTLAASFVLPVSSSQFRPPSFVLLDVDEQARRAADIEPALVLAGATPRLIDEWQVAPLIWNHVRRMVDSRGQPGQFILTGSAVPADDITRHTGAGRLARVRMRPMSLFESGHGTGSASIAALLEGRCSTTPDPGLTIARLAELIAVGGWPGNLGKTTAEALAAVRSYIDEIRRADISRVDGVKRDPAKVGRLLRSRTLNTCGHGRDEEGSGGGLTQDGG